MEEGNSESHTEDSLSEGQVSGEQSTEIENHNGETQDDTASAEAVEETMVPISALKKERKKRQQIQQELEKRASQQKPVEEDYSRYESVTKEELGKNNFELKREVREEDWSKNFPDRATQLEENLEEFLQQRPNLALAIQGSSNRLQEAWELMEALRPKKTQVKRQNQDVPKAPGTVPKSAALNNAIDLMSMSDSEFRDWRKGKARSR